jgi:hydroxyacylglutathione hydrolase
MFFKQIKHRGDNFSYIIADNRSKEAAVVDPSFHGDEIIRLTRSQNLNVRYIINTHSHRDHVAGNEDIETCFGAEVIAHKLAKIDKKIGVVDGSVIKLGAVVVQVIHTPGHSADSICLLVDNKLLTGDTLFVGECGRTDLPGGSAEDMYNSLFHKLMKLNDDIEVYPGHDYGSKPHSTIGEEKRTNYTLEKRTLQEFIKFMKQP